MYEPQTRWRNKYTEQQQELFNSLIMEGQYSSKDNSDQNFFELDQEILASLTSRQAQENIYGSMDRRQLVQNTLQYPYSAIGLIQIKMKNNKSSYVGTGFLVGPNLVLTCAHNFSHPYYGQAQKAYFSPALNGEKGKKVQVKQFLICPQYETSKAHFDFAILKLKQSIGNIYGTLGLDFSEKEKGDEAFIYGYPGKVNVNGREEQGKRRMFGMKGRWEINGFKIRYYTISTSHGQSGSPIFIRKNGKYYAIGIHTDGEQLTRGYGLNLDNRVRKMINELINKKSGKLELSWTKVQDLDMENLIKEDFGNLEHLHVWNNDITTSGAQLICEKFTNLKCLNLSSIKRLANLILLRIDNNKLTTVGSSIQKLTDLKQLFIDRNYLTELPRQLGQLRNLQKLQIQTNNLKELPKQIGQLNNLEKLSVYNNELSYLPEEIGKLGNLQVLLANNNELSQLRDSIKMLKKLEEFCIHHNKLPQLPNSIGQLTNLKIFLVSFNQLTCLPTAINRIMRNLRRFEYHHNYMYNNVDI